MTYTISPAGLALIQAFEGFRRDPTQLPNGGWVVGYGHVRAEAGAALSEVEAADLLVIDVAPFEMLVNEAVTKPLGQCQFDALVSFAFSVGAEAFARSQVLRRVNSGDFVAAACAMDAWRKSDAGGALEIVDALVRRRAAEKALFLREAALQTAPSALLRPKLDYAAAVLGAPVAYAGAPDFLSVSVARARPNPAQRLVEILRSEPATEALLLTHVVAEDVGDDEEIVTAHAKPVARKIESPPPPARGIKLPMIGAVGAVERLGRAALFAFGVCLIAIGGSIMFSAGVDASDIAGATVLAAPGLAVASAAAFAMWRGRLLKHAKA